MDEKQFKEMIRFAIGREVEAINFYNQANKMVKQSGTKELFLDFELPRFDLIHKFYAVINVFDTMYSEPCQLLRWHGR